MSAENNFQHRICCSSRQTETKNITHEIVQETTQPRKAVELEVEMSHNIC